MNEQAPNPSTKDAAQHRACDMPRRPSLDVEDPAQLLNYLRCSDRIAPDQTPQFQTLPGGVSNRTVLVNRTSGESWVIKQALHKLRVKVDWFSDPARIQREALGLRWLEKLAPPGTITPLIFEDSEHHLLAMQAVPQPHENWKTMLMSGRVDLGLVEQFSYLLHSIFANSRSHPQLPEIFSDRSFFESLRVEPYYQYTAAQVPEAAEFLHELIADTRANASSLVHGDYSPKNVLVRNGRLVLLDHEVIHWGDPCFDVGFAMTHFLSKAHHLPAHRSPFLDAARKFASGLPAELIAERGVRHALACLLARVSGRSPLEYLDDAERARQRRVVLRLLSDPPQRNMPELVDRFARQLDED